MIEVFLSILKCRRRKLLNAHGLTLMTRSLCGWEAVSTPGALSRIRITWALSPILPQVPGVTLGSLLCPWCFGHSSWKGVPHIDNVLTLMDFTLWLNLNTEASHLVRHTWNMPFFASKKNSIQCNMNVVHINQYGCLKIGMIHTIWSSRCSCKFNWQCNMHMVVNNML